MSLTITLLVISISLFLGNLILIFLDKKPKPIKHQTIKHEKKVELLESRLQSLEKLVLTNELKGKIPSREETLSNLKNHKENLSFSQKDNEQIQSILNYY